MAASLQLRRAGPSNTSAADDAGTMSSNSRSNPRRVTNSLQRRGNKPSILSNPIAQVLVGAATLLIVVWIASAFYLTTSLQNQNLLRRDSQLTPASSPTIVAKEDEVVDMRDLSYQLPFDNPDGGAWKQGWDVQPKEGPIKIFVLPHSHCDPGWIKTFDEYFQQQTKNILTSVVTALSRNPLRKFIWAEISYFEWWWREQSEDIRELTRGLLKSGQLEFVTGGWVQTDEANSQLYAMEIQLQEGHDWIRKTFGEEYIPRYGWSIDPFGYSPTMAYLLKKYGFEGMLIQRVHYAIKKELAKRQHLEFMWRQTWDPSGKHDIFTHVMPFYSYDIPHTCGPDPSVCCQFDYGRAPMGTYGACPWRKNPQTITDENVKERAMLLLDQYRKKSALYRSNVVIAPLGDDFRYMTIDEAENQYVNYQKIFDYLNANVPGVQAQFGTLSDYFKAVKGAFAPPILKGSFFTYSDREQDYWSGYYTSRVFDKALDRTLERVLYAASAMGAGKEALQESRRALSLFQHHDGVTGTAKDHVVRDYAKRIHTAILDTQKMMIEEVSSNIPPDQIQDGGLRPCWMSDAPRGLSQNLCREEHPIVVYNPLKTPQYCGRVMVPGKSIGTAQLPCEKAGPRDAKGSGFKFDPRTGLMTHPVKEEWMVWKVNEGGAYLFFPGDLATYEGEVTIEQDGFVVSTPGWKRTIVQQLIPSDFHTSSTVLDFVYETNLQTSNQEWFVRFTGNVANQGVFHTDLNGFNFDTHRFRKDMPIQSQVFPMPTLASIEDLHTRMTVLSEHAQGTASIQEGSIDVWLDRRLAQDDNRGLGQGVKDNVPTRTRLRLLIETEGFETKGEFRISPLSRRMWDELNHPLELFGYHAPAPKPVRGTEVEHTGASAERRRVLSNSSKTAVPFVYMVHKRIDYLMRAIDSLRDSDFPKSEVPLIISHDGHIKEMTSYVESLKGEFIIVQLFHPFSCSDHPNSFPGDDPKLNEGYRGDTYGNKRTGSVTCAKHHFTWMMQTLLEQHSDYSAFFFMEEDYVVAPTIYSTITSGLSLVRTHPLSKSFFGLALDITDGHTRHVRASEDSWIVSSFVTGPMAITRQVMEKIRQLGREYCTFDEYNWDWSVVYLQNKFSLPYAVLYPSKPQALHIGAEGMHGKHVKGAKLKKIQQTTIPPPFDANTGISNEWVLHTLRPKRHERGYGGWGHPADQNHCMQIFQPGSTFIVPFNSSTQFEGSLERVLANLNPLRWFH